MVQHSCRIKAGQYMEMVLRRRKQPTTWLAASLSMTLICHLSPQVLTQTSTQFPRALAVMDSKVVTTVMGLRMVGLGVWKSTGLNPTATVVVPQPCTPNHTMVQMDALHGDAEQTITTMAGPPSTCASNMALMAAGLPFEMDRLSMQAPCLQHLVNLIGTRSRAHMRARAPSSTHQSGRAGFLWMIVDPLATWVALISPSTISESKVLLCKDQHHKNVATFQQATLLSLSKQV